MTLGITRSRATLRGILWMATAGVFFAITFALIRQLSETMHTFQIVLVRSLFALLVMLPWLYRAGLGRLRTRRGAREKKNRVML